MEETLRVVLAMVVFNLFLPGDPIWLLIVGGSGRSKTEILNSIADLRGIIALSNLTYSSLVSGLQHQKRKGFGLLQQLPAGGNFVILVKDMSAIFSQHPDTRNDLLALLRSVYDGEYKRNFGNQVNVDWSGRIGFIGATTPVIDQLSGVRQKFGERFLFWRVEKEDLNGDIMLTARAIKKQGQEKVWREELRTAVYDFFNQLQLRDPQLPCDLDIKISYLANFVSYARSYVPRDYRTREIDDVPQFEVGTRLGKMLYSLCKGLALLRDSKEFECEDYAIIKKVALNSIPKVRTLVLDALARLKGADTSTVANHVGLPWSTTKMVLTDLEALGLVVCGSNWVLSNECVQLIHGAGYDDNIIFFEK
ncbi:MAG: hypothetical protein QXT73_08850 [Candidatus Methanomethylicaceae archaeon]